MATAGQGIPVTTELIRGVVFDMDGTLTMPTMDWKKVRSKLGVPEGADILIYLESLPQGSEKFGQAMRGIREEEERARRDLELRAACVETLEGLRERGVEIALLTRNCDAGVRAMLEMMGSEYGGSGKPLFSQVVTRSFRPTKPAPDPLLHICEKWSFSPRQVVMVGDSRDDYECGKAAGATTIIVRTAYNAVVADDAHHAITTLDEIIPIVERRLPASAKSSAQP